VKRSTSPSHGCVLYQSTKPNHAFGTEPTTVERNQVRYTVLIKLQYGLISVLEDESCMNDEDSEIEFASVRKTGTGILGRQSVR
jgi:hypothetical protein